MKKIIPCLLLTFTLSLINSSTLFSQAVLWNFDSQSTSSSSGPADVAASAAVFGPGITVSTPAFPQGNPTTGFAYSGEAWPTGALNTDDYIEFCVTNNHGQTITVNNFSFDERRSGTGIRDIEVRSSVDGFSNSIFNTNVPDNTSWRTQSITSLNYSVPNNDQVCFRVYGYTAEGAGGTWRFDNVMISGSAPLPVKLSDFEIENKNEKVVLKWTTLSEVNNSHFIVAHSTDGKRFNEIGKIDGNGNSSAEIHYDYIHENPVNGVNYYQLTQVDFDGRSESFEVKWVKVGNGNNIKIYPFHVNNDLFIDGVKDGTIMIYNALGSLVYSQKADKRIDISGLPSGIYMVRINELVQKIYKQ